MIYHPISIEMLHDLHCISAYMTGSCSTEAFGELRARQQPRGPDNGPLLLLNLRFFWGGHWNFHAFLWDYAHMIFILFVPCLQRLDTSMIIWSLKLCVIYWDWFLTCDPLFHKKGLITHNRHNLRSVGYSDIPSPVTRLRARILHRTSSVSE